MLFGFVWCCFFAFANAHLQPITLPVYVPPSEEVILNKYFQPEANKNNETVPNDGENNAEGIHETINWMKNDSAKNTTTLRNETFNGTDANTSNAITDVVWTGLLKNLLRNTYETTTYKYPTATWTAEQYEKLKEQRRNQFKKIPKIFLMKPSLLLKPVRTLQDGKSSKPVLTQKPKRGKIKWKDSRRKLSTDAAYRGLAKEEVDRFLEQSLFRYLVSSNLIENIGNISVETFSEVLRNITRHKADRRQIWPYDENKELRIKFRDEVFMKKKAENPTRGRFLEKQFQRRLERMKDYFNAKNKERAWRSRNAVELTNKKQEAFTSTTQNIITEATQVQPMLTTEHATERSTAEFSETELPAYTEVPQTNFVSKPTTTGKPDFEELKLSVAETVYYKKRPFPLHTYSFEEEGTGVIPGIPEVDYPMYSSPPSTGFRCPKGIGEQPRMMADTQTRCQVFYVCTGDGPAAAMLCPNGTMFNENVRVCDWWYNVDC